MTMWAFRLLVALLFLLAPVHARAGQRTKEYPVTGMIVSIAPAAKTFTASIQAIPNFMAAMTMPFEVRQASELQGLTPGTVVSFTLVVEPNTSYATRIAVVPYSNTEQDPFSANRLKLLSDIAAGKQGRPAEMVAVGGPVPDFSLVDQKRRPTSLSQFRGKVVVANFIYTTCALPNFCLRLANNFGVLQKRFAAQMGKDLVLLTITFDPTHDTPEVMAQYASQWSANADTWRFLTGPATDVERACRLFGVHAFATEGLMDHSLHTAIIGRDGRLVANIEGNQFTATQLGDVVAATLTALPK
ncbi:MAG: SCO family protein [Acidobacteria bacterium]|nr:SCO family protein [Acidobacteriota bacterium]